ncbi:MAG: biotin synthase BioB [Candidatus Glassbacteria bacterium]|nr:biotin synthase BioB [Candidatus Glassbacteria bacterium]
MAAGTLATIERALEERGRLGEREARLVLADKSLELGALIAVTDRLRRSHSGNRIRLCSIVNARSGGCPEDCAFCAQSARHGTRVERYPLLPAERLIEAAVNARHSGAGEFSIVTSGRSLGNGRQLTTVETALKEIGDRCSGIQRCASLGRVEPRLLERLKAAGLDCFHHNLEACREFFPRICTTHSYQDRVEMVRLARAAGLRVCSGGIFGMGESPDQRVALALELAALEVDSVPLNFLHPIPGTPLENVCRLTPHECLRIIAMFRLVLPDKDIIVCGGREVNLGQMQPMIFRAGANGILIGNYLTTEGGSVPDDLQMLEDLGLEPYYQGGRDRTGS